MLYRYIFFKYILTLYKVVAVNKAGAIPRIEWPTFFPLLEFSCDDAVSGSVGSICTPGPDSCSFPEVWYLSGVFAVTFFSAILMWHGKVDKTILGLYSLEL